MAGAAGHRPSHRPTGNYGGYRAGAIDRRRAAVGGGGAGQRGHHKPLDPLPRRFGVY